MLEIGYNRVLRFDIRILEYIDFSYKFRESQLKNPFWKYLKNIGRMNADLVPIKLLCVQSGSKSYDPSQHYNSFYGKSTVIKWSYFSAFSNCVFIRKWYMRK